MEAGNKRVTCRWVLVLLMLVHVTLLSIPAINNSPTIDEVYFLPAGIAHWNWGRFELCVVNPPLVRMVAAMPALAFDLQFNPGPSRPAVERADRPLGIGLVRDNAEVLPYLISATRMACFPFSLVALWMCFQWSKELYGNTAGYLAATLWCFSPFALGHGSLITADVGAAATGLVAIFAFRNWLKTSTLDNSFLLGIATSLPLLAKFTWIPILPATALIVLPIWRGSDGCRWSVLRRDVGHMVLAAATALLAINVLYLFDSSFRKLGDIEFVSVGLKPTQASDIEAGSQAANVFSGTLLGEVPVPIPAWYLQGIDIQRKGFEPGPRSRSYLMGEWQEGGWWYYYIVGLLVKETVAEVVLFILALAFAIWRWRMNFNLTDVREAAALLVPALLMFVLVSSQTGFNRHVRYVIPCIPLVLIWISQLAAVKQLWTRKLVTILLCVQIISVLWHGPHWISYFNEAAGGPRRGSGWLDNSNIDWGQDLWYLRRWIQQHPENSVKAAVFTVYPLSAVGLSLQPPVPFEIGTEKSQDHDKFQVPQPGWFAVSVNKQKTTVSLSGKSHDLSEYAGPYRYFEKFSPVAMVGYSIFIYDIDAEQAKGPAQNEGKR